MKRILMGALATASLLVATVASAQVSTTANPPFSVSSAPMTSAITPGTSGANVGTFTISGGPSGGNSITSIPLTLSTSGGGTASDLSNCQVFDANGTSLSSAASSLQTGNNTIQFSPALSFNGGSLVTYTVKCNIATSSPTGAMYFLSAGQPSISGGTAATTTTTATSTTGGSLAVGYAASPSIIPGVRNVVGIISLDAAGSNAGARITSIPLTVSFSGGASSANLTNCGLAQTNAITTSLNTGTNAVSTLNNQTTITLDTPGTISAGAAALNYALLCDLSASAPVGGTVTVTLNPSGIAATNTSGGTITPTGAVGSGGTATTPSGTSVIRSASNIPSTTGGTPTPGVPNTGAGSAAVGTFGILALTGVISLLGVTYLSLRKKEELY